METQALIFFTGQRILWNVNTGAPGIWYTITGTGFDITASLCGSSFDTKTQVFEGPCAGLTCIDGNDDFCGLQSEQTWTSVNGTVYYIYAYGFGTEKGIYADHNMLDLREMLVMMRLLLPVGQPQRQARLMLPGRTTGSVELLVATVGGIWFTLLVPVETYVSLCNAATSFDTKMQVLGTCAALVCVDGNDDFAESSLRLVGPLLQERTLHHVYGFGSEEGALELD